MKADAAAKLLHGLIPQMGPQMAEAVREVLAHRRCLLSDLASKSARLQKAEADRASLHLRLRSKVRAAAADTPPWPEDKDF